MKIKNLSCLGLAMLALTAVGCVQEVNFKEGGDAEICKSMTVKVVDGGYQDKIVTRAGESNEEEPEGESTVMRTRFMAGDKIGVFSISSGGATHYKNLELVYDGTEWKNPDGETFFYFSGMKYAKYDTQYRINRINSIINYDQIDMFRYLEGLEKLGGKK